MDQKSYFKITEPTLEQEVAAYFAKNLGGKVATQGSPEGGGGNRLPQLLRLFLKTPDP